jgi:hypothetical protein
MQWHTAPPLSTSTGMEARVSGDVHHAMMAGWQSNDNDSLEWLQWLWLQQQWPWVNNCHDDNACIDTTTLPQGWCMHDDCNNDCHRWISVKKKVKKAANSQKKQPKVGKSWRKVDISLTFPNFWSLFLTISNFLFYIGWMAKMMTAITTMMATPQTTTTAVRHCHEEGRSLTFYFLLTLRYCTVAHSLYLTVRTLDSEMRNCDWLKVRVWFRPSPLQVWPNMNPDPL